MDITIRTILPEDDTALAQVIRSALTEFGANKPGTVYYDNSTDHLSRVFTLPNSIYYVVSIDGVVAGGAGIYPTEGLPADTCELVKMYLAKLARGKGLGRQLIEKCILFAKTKGYSKMYLETLPELYAAVAIYKKMGFAALPHALGNSGHFGCDMWMLKEI